jgi:hypothetical protein
MFDPEYAAQLWGRDHSGYRFGVSTREPFGLKSANGAKGGGP